MSAPVPYRVLLEPVPWQAQQGRPNRWQGWACHRHRPKKIARLGLYHFGFFFLTQCARVPLSKGHYSCSRDNKTKLHFRALDEAIDVDSEAYCWRRNGFFWRMRASLVSPRPSVRSSHHLVLSDFRQSQPAVPRRAPTCLSRFT